MAGRRITVVRSPTGVEAFERADVLVVHVDVHERRDLAAVLEHLASEPREPLGEIGEELADGGSGGVHLAGAADRVAERRWNADARHEATWVLPPWQNST